MLAGNKKDLCEESEEGNMNERQVDTQEAGEVAKMYEMDFRETSAKTDEGVKELMEDIFERIL